MFRHYTLYVEWIHPVTYQVFALREVVQGWIWEQLGEEGQKHLKKEIVAKLARNVFEQLNVEVEVG